MIHSIEFILTNVMMTTRRIAWLLSHTLPHPSHERSLYCEQIVLYPLSNDLTLTDDIILVSLLQRMTRGKREDR